MKPFPYAVYPGLGGLQKSIAIEEEDPNDGPIPEHHDMGKVHAKLAAHVRRLNRKHGQHRRNEKHRE